jgi:hypothetical protein
LVALVVEQGGHDLLQGPLPVTESEAAGGGNGVEVLVTHVSQEAEGVSSRRQSFEQANEVGVLRRVVAGVPAVISGTIDVATRSVGAGEKPWDSVTALSRSSARAGHSAIGLQKFCDPQIVVGRMRREGSDGAVAELFATDAGEAQDRFVWRGEEADQIGDLPVGRLQKLDATFAH